MQHSVKRAPAPAIKLKMSISYSAQLHVRKQIEVHDVSPTAAPGEQEIRKCTDTWINSLLIVCMSACVFVTYVFDNDGGKLQRCRPEAWRQTDVGPGPSEDPKRAEGWKPKVRVPEDQRQGPADPARGWPPWYESLTGPQKPRTTWHPAVFVLY